MGFNRVFIPPQKKIRKIALEEHYITQALAPYSADSKLSVGTEAMAEFERRLVDMDGLRLEEMDQTGGGTAVLRQPFAESAESRESAAAAAA